MALPPGAAEEDAGRVVVSGVSTETGWVSHWVTGTGGFSARVTGRDLAGTSSVHVRIFHADGSAGAGASITYYAGWTGARVVVVDGRGGEPVEFVHGIDGALGDPITFRVVDDAFSGPKAVLFFAAGGVGRWDYEVEYDDGELLATDSGNRTFVLGPRDFEGPLALGVGLGSATLERIDNGSIRLEIRDRLIGFYRFDPSRLEPVFGAPEVGVRTPAGGRLECDCDFTDVVGPTALGPGTYEFGFSGTSARVWYGGEPWIIVADARLPPTPSKLD